MVNLFAVARLDLRLGEPVAVVILGFNFAMVKLFFAATNTVLRCSEQTSDDQQIPSNLVSSITLLDFPSNSVKHKKMGD